MKNSYPDSYISLASAINAACSSYTSNRVQHHSTNNRMGKSILRINDKQTSIHKRVGIKFDNISAGKYFVLIQTTQQKMNRTSEKEDARCNR